MDVTSFLKTVPAVIGLAGLLTYYMREQSPASNVELVNLVRYVQTGFVLLGCTALILLSLWLFFRSQPPGQDAALPGHSIARAAPYSGQQSSNGQAMLQASEREIARDPATSAG